MNIRIFFALLVVIILSACSKSKTINPPPFSPPAQHEAKRDSILERLLHQHGQWRGTPHKIGGLSRQGIDCSGFTQITYLRLFRMNLPRTTDEQSKLGQRVNFNNLKPGDLLFFKTGWFSKHVGMYLNHNKFLHASTSRGVIISSLDEKYWKRNFYLAKRFNIH